MIIREKYLSKIRPFYEYDLIKVITGIIRCGKSVILKQIMNELKANGVKDEQIIYINFEFEEYYNLYIENKITNNNKYYLFFNEIQKIKKRN